MTKRRTTQTKRTGMEPALGGALRQTPPGEVLKPRDAAGWMKGRVDGHFFEAKVYDTPSDYGIDDGRVSKLCISSGAQWAGLNDAIFNYDRGLDFDETPAGLLDQILAFIEANYQ